MQRGGAALRATGHLVESRPRLILLGLLVTLAALIVQRARAIPFWYDELFTFYLSQLSFPDLLSSLREGADLNPPLFYLLTQAFQLAFGANEAATRGPAILGFLVFIATIFSFLRRRTGPTVAIAALCLPVASGAFPYAFEARPYGLVLGFCGVALRLWQRIAEDRALSWSRCASLMACLAGALLCHAYAVFILVPLCAGEAVRCYRRRKIEWPVWVALLLPGALVFLHLAMLPGLQVFSMVAPGLHPVPGGIPQAYRFLLDPTSPALLLALALAGFLGRSGDPGRDGAHLPAPPAHEIVAAATLALAPLGVYVVGVLITGIAMPRYALITIGGMTILFGFLLYRAGQGQPALPLAVAAILLASLPIRMLLRETHAVPIAEYSALSGLEDLEPDLPVAVADGLEFLELSHYGSAKLRSRLIYLRDAKTAVDYTGTDVFDANTEPLVKWFRLPLQFHDYRTFLDSGAPFLVYGGTGTYEWLMRKLVDDKVPLQMIRMNGAYVAKVTPARSLAPAAAAANGSR
jgi:hypothetical protein